mmetsp:Transcript_58878/g.111066  ORF Transcript_58878/g.111066 Transcript_58878/m.111066 type:complete len:162 (-) Transcript_58878:65-550(-)
MPDMGAERAGAGNFAAGNFASGNFASGNFASGNFGSTTGAFGAFGCDLETAAQVEAKKRRSIDAPPPGNHSRASPRGIADPQRNNSFRFDPIATVVSVEIPAQRHVNWSHRPQANRVKEKEKGGKLLDGGRNGIFNLCCPSNMVKLPQGDNACIPVGQTQA